jgi:hypothetical protein
VETLRKRPGAATVLGILAYVNAIIQLISAVAAIVLMLRPGQVQLLFGDSVSDVYWIISAALSGFLFFAYIWLAKGIFAGLDYAWTVVNLLAIINLLFGFFYLFQGTGLLMVLISVLVLLLNNTRGVRDWYGTT